MARLAWLAGLSAAVAMAFACSPRPDADLQTAPAATTAATNEPLDQAAAFEWQPCHREYECAVLTVPLDYSGAAPGTVDFGVMRWRAAAPDARIGSLVINPGGPGGSGTDFLRSRSVEGWSELHQHFDIIGFDPRGVGDDGPAVDCVDDLDSYFDVADPYSPADEAELIRVTMEFADGCEQRSGWLLPFLSAEFVVRDIDQIRIALGEEQISYLGFSYGTYLGSLYAELFPTRVRAMVLDGAVNPALDAREWQKQQAIGFETAFNAFAANCDQDPSCQLRELPGGAARAYDTLMDELQVRPLPVASRTLGRSEAENGVLVALYNRGSWPFLATAIADALDGDGELLFSMFDSFVGRDEDGGYDDSTEIYRAVSCVDLAFPTDLAEYAAWADEFEGVAPRFGRALAYEHIDCATWPAPPATVPSITGEGAPPILIVGTTRDPATPLIWAQALAAQLVSGVLVEVDGDGHTAYGRNDCLTRIVDVYLTELEAPESGTKCPEES
jgi:pimeloyl-ACP methyl ester carboxylesterase